MSGIFTFVICYPVSTLDLSSILRLAYLVFVDINSVCFVYSSVLPRFSHPDVNFWIWVFGRRYREVLRAWAEAASRSPSSPTGALGMELGANDRRINWTGTAVNQFYAAVRKALVIVLVLRTLGILIAMGVGAWWVFFQ